MHVFSQCFPTSIQIIYSIHFLPQGAKRWKRYRPVNCPQKRDCKRRHPGTLERFLTHLLQNRSTHCVHLHFLGTIEKNLLWYGVVPANGQFQLKTVIDRNLGDFVTWWKIYSSDSFWDLVFKKLKFFKRRRLVDWKVFSDVLNKYGWLSTLGRTRL